MTDEPTTARLTDLAFRQAVMRVANERITAWPERKAADSAGELLFYCECSDLSCKEHLSLRADQYEAVRAHSNQFVVSAGHGCLEVERVIDAHDGYQIVATLDAVAALLTATDPRAG